MLNRPLINRIRSVWYPVPYNKRKPWRRDIPEMVNVEVPRETNLLYILSVIVETKTTKNRIFSNIYIYICCITYHLRSSSFPTRNWKLKKNFNVAFVVPANLILFLPAFPLVLKWSDLEGTKSLYTYIYILHGIALKIIVISDTKLKKFNVAFVVPANLILLLLSVSSNPKNQATRRERKICFYR